MEVSGASILHVVQQLSGDGDRVYHMTLTFEYFVETNRSQENWYKQFLHKYIQKALLCVSQHTTGEEFIWI